MSEKKTIQLPKECSFEELKNKVLKMNNPIFIGERKWSLKLNQKILEDEQIKEKPGLKAETGIFLTKDISDLDNFKNCTRLVFFNSDEQFQFIAVDISCEKYIYHHSTIKENEEEKKIIKENFKTLLMGDNNHFKYSFANRLGAINKNLEEKIHAIIDKNSGEWRLSYGK